MEKKKINILGGALMFLVAVIGFAIGLKAGSTYLWAIPGTGSNRNTPAVGIPVAGTSFVPGTTNAISLGSTSARWSGAYSNGFDVGSTGSIVKRPATVQSVAVNSTVITPYPFTLIGSTGALTLAGVPNIATTSITSGTEIIVKSTANAITMTDQAVLTTSGLCLNANTVAITTSTPVHMIFDGTCWQMVR